MPKIAFMISPGREYVAILWGIWLAGGMGIPLSSSYPESEIEWFLKDAETDGLITETELTEKYSVLAKKTGVKCFDSSLPLSFSQKMKLPEFTSDLNALLLYTSGTTGKPKGVLLTHENLASQISTLIYSWKWTGEDRILHSLPLHHTHGILNALCCALASGAAVEFLHPFDPAKTWDAFATGKISVYMAVPTMYVRLLREWNKAGEKQKIIWADAAANLRLMVSGSAPLSSEVFAAWKKVTGHSLLERYGMTETGMILSNPLTGERKPGTVGQPLPGVAIKLSITENGDEIRVKGKSVFGGYWNRPDANKDSFDNEGYFKTGDIAVIENGYYRLLGRASLDIIKSGGYKISAVETEEILLSHPSVLEVAVTGIPDAEWGERVAAVLVLKTDANIDLEILREWCRDKMPVYRMPSAMKIINELPRNVMGKVDKKIVKAFFSE